MSFLVLHFAKEQEARQVPLLAMVQVQVLATV
jgi:hypothetical protein